MGYRELIDSLRVECEEKARKIWLEAESEADRVRADASRRLDEGRDGRERSQSGALKILTESILSEASDKARALRLVTEKELSDRLYRIALNSLRHMREKGYKDLFSALVNELPHYEWGTVKVNPEDKPIAQEFFPDTEVVSDSAVSGGLEVTERGGGVRVVNTLDKRLERIWPEVLPGIMDEIRILVEKET
ncbi:MAG TPA: V-type ATP synthase subunit E [Thermodesulfovibrionales bacterium]|nr:V-type ATP synthase subunit E [Thermodesulfovibrionales bacterium]